MDSAWNAGRIGHVSYPIQGRVLVKKLFLLALIVTSTAAFAQTNVRVRATVTAVEGNVLSVKTPDGRDLKVHLPPDASGAPGKAIKLDEPPAHAHARGTAGG